MNIEELNKINQQLLLILGATLPLIMRTKSETAQEQRARTWILEAIEAVAYKNENIPEIPR